MSRNLASEAAEGFLRSVLRSRLLDREQLVDALRSVGKDRLGDPQAIADHLIQLGKLSRYQATKLLQGATLGLRLGHFQIVTPLGRGGMGVVYLAMDTRNGQHVAIKVLPPKRAREEERYLARFQREIELSRKVSHPHIASTHDAGVSQGVNYLAMEYIPGQSLYRLVSSEGPLPVARAAHLFKEVCAALEHAHGLGLIHRDLKPSNIMITPNDHAKVLDFGLAMVQGEAAEDVEVIGGRGYVVGSVDYMAPEQTLDATHVDGRSDLYAMGCCLYFALTGRAPFPGGKTRDKLNAHRHQEPDPIQWKNKQVPDAFAAVIHKLMAKRPSERFQSAAEIRAQLSTWAPMLEARPVEREGDPTFKAAVAALETRELSGSINDAEIPVILPPAALEPEPTEPILPAELLEGKERSEMMMLILGFGAFWIVVLLILLVVMMLQ